MISCYDSTKSTWTHTSKDMFSSESGIWGAILFTILEFLPPGGHLVLTVDWYLCGPATRDNVNLLSSQNIGYVIPVPIIEHFLEDTDPQERH